MIASLLQARIGSVRLPSKVLKELPEGSGVSMLARVIRRLKKCETLDEIIVVTPDEPCAVIARKEGVKYSRLIQDKRNVLAEFYHAAKKFGVETIVRITGDCPCVSHRIVDALIYDHIADGKDITCNRNDDLAYYSEVDGLDVEVFSLEALEKAYKHAQLPEEKEHVTRWMYENLRATIVRCGWLTNGLNELKLSVDNQDDFDRICKIYEDLGPDFTMRQLRENLEKEKVKWQSTK